MSILRLVLLLSVSLAASVNVESYLQELEVLHKDLEAHEVFASKLVDSLFQKIQTIAGESDPSVGIFGKKVKKYQTDLKILQEDLRAHEQDATTVVKELQMKAAELEDSNTQCNDQLEQTNKCPEREVAPSDSHQVERLKAEIVELKKTARNHKDKISHLKALGLKRKKEMEAKELACANKGDDSSFSPSFDIDYNATMAHPYETMFQNWSLGRLRSLGNVFAVQFCAELGASKERLDRFRRPAAFKNKERFAPSTRLPNGEIVSSVSVQMLSVPLDASERATQIPSPTTVKRMTDQLDEFGILVLQKVIPPELCQRLRRDTHLHATRPFHEYGSLRKSQYRKQHPLRLTSSVQEGLEMIARYLEGALTKLLGKDAMLMELSTINTYPGAKGQSWHTDTPFEDLTVDPADVMGGFLYLDDIGDQDSPTDIIPGSHNLANFWRVSERQVLAVEDRQSFVRFALPKGSLLVYNLRNIHRGTPHRGKVPRASLYFSFSVNANTNSKSPPSGPTYMIHPRYYRSIYLNHILAGDYKHRHTTDTIHMKISNAVEKITLETCEKKFTKHCTNYTDTKSCYACMADYVDNGHGHKLNGYCVFGLMERLCKLGIWAPDYVVPPEYATPLSGCKSKPNTEEFHLLADMPEEYYKVEDEILEENVCESAVARACMDAYVANDCVESDATRMVNRTQCKTFATCLGEGDELCASTFTFLRENIPDGTEFHKHSTFVKEWKFDTQKFWPQEDLLLVFDSGDEIGPDQVVVKQLKPYTKSSISITIDTGSETGVKKANYRLEVPSRAESSEFKAIAWFYLEVKVVEDDEEPAPIDVTALEDEAGETEEVLSGSTIYENEITLQDGSNEHELGEFFFYLNKKPNLDEVRKRLKEQEKGALVRACIHMHAQACLLSLAIIY